MKPIYFSPLFAVLFFASFSVNAAGSMLRIACAPESKGAEVIINGKFKGQCPLDIQVPEGVVKLTVKQVVDDLEERVYEEEMRIGDGVVKKVDVELGPGTLSAKGRQYFSKYIAAKLQKHEQDANSGDVKAMMQMASNYQFGFHGMLAKSDEKYVFWLRKAADAGHPEAMRSVAEMYEAGKYGLPKNVEQSQVWLFKAAKAGSHSAMLRLAAAYSFAASYGLKLDAAQADIWSANAFEAQLKEAKAGNPLQMKNVGDSYMAGHSVKVDRNEGLAWLTRSAVIYRKLADAGDWVAMNALSEAIFDENGERMSKEQKQNWSKMAKVYQGRFTEFAELKTYVRRVEGPAR